MGYPNSSEFSPNLTIAEHPHQVNKVVKTLSVNDKYADQGVVFHTELVEMDDAIRYIVTTNVIESEKERTKDPSLKQYAASNIVDIEGSAWTTKYGKMYHDRNVELALNMHRPSMFVGVQQNLNRYNSLDRTTDDMLAIHAFMAARYSYDMDYVTAKGTSRGGMLAINLQKRAPQYDQKVLYSYSMVPCIPFKTDILKLLYPRNILSLAKNELNAIKSLDRSPSEVLQMYDMLDILSVRGLTQQLKEVASLGTSGIGMTVRKSETKDEVGDIKVQRGDTLSFALKWPILFRDYPNTNVDILPLGTSESTGGHMSCISNQYHEDWRLAAEASSFVLHSGAEARTYDNNTLRRLIDDEMRYQRMFE